MAASSATPTVTPALCKSDRSIHDAFMVGFDLDHCIARYNRPAVSNLIFKALVEYLVPHHGWPQSLLTADPRLDLNAKGVVFELATGNFLRIAADGAVCQAFHGTTTMTHEDIEAVYGSGPWEHFEALCSMKRHPSFLLFLTYFDMPATGLLAHMVDAVDGGWEPEGGRPDGAVGYEHLFPMLFSAFAHTFDNVEGFAPRRGGFFPPLQDHPATYLLPRPALKKWLCARSERGQYTFLATNSCPEFATFLLKHSLGEDWKTCFDFLIMDAQKGAFFTQSAPLLHLDDAGVTGGDPAVSAAFPSSAVFVNGNAGVLEEAARQLQSGKAAPITVALNTDGKAVRHAHPVGEGLVDGMQDAASGGKHADLGIWYAGDHLHGDVGAAAGIGWHAIAVVEEMAQEAGVGAVTGEGAFQSCPVTVQGDDDFTARFPALTGVQCGSAWGQDWFLLPQKGEQVETHTTAMLRDTAALVVADIEALAFMTPEQTTASK